MAHICSCSLLVFTTALGPPPPTLIDKDKDVGSGNLELARFKQTNTTVNIKHTGVDCFSLVVFLGPLNKMNL